MSASSPEQEFDESAVKHSKLSKSSLEQKLKHLLTERGIYGVRFLHKVFRCLDKEGSGCLEEADFRWGLNSGKIFVSEEEAQFIVQNHLCQSGVCYRKFLQDLRGNLNQTRKQAICEAYTRARKVIGDEIKLEDLGRIYDAKRHPEVLTHKKSEKDAFNEFIWSWDNIKPDYVVSLE